jgi:hypothetical protein
LGIVFMQRIPTTLDSIGRLGAALIIGPILTSVLVFAAYELGIPVGTPLAWSILTVAAVFCVVGFLSRAVRAAFGIDLGFSTLGIVLAAHAEMGRVMGVMLQWRGAACQDRRGPGSGAMPNQRSAQPIEHATRLAPCEQRICA